MQQYLCVTQGLGQDKPGQIFCLALTFSTAQIQLLADRICSSQCPVQPWESVHCGDVWWGDVWWGDVWCDVSISINQSLWHLITVLWTCVWINSFAVRVCFQNVQHFYFPFTSSKIEANRNSTWLIRHAKWWVGPLTSLLHISTQPLTLHTKSNGFTGHQPSPFQTHKCKNWWHLVFPWWQKCACMCVCVWGGGGATDIPFLTILFPCTCKTVCQAL